MTTEVAAAAEEEEEKDKEEEEHELQNQARIEQFHFRVRKEGTRRY